MNNKKNQFIKDTLGTREKYHEIITNHSFTNDEKDILLHASVNIHHSKIDKTLINKAYYILISKSILDTATNKQNRSLNTVIEYIDIFEKKIHDGSLKTAIQNYFNFDREIKTIDIPIIIFVITLAVAFIYFSMDNHSNERKTTSSTSSQNSSYKQKGNVHGAWAYMQIFVEKRLKSPKSADFPFGGGTYHTKDLGGGRYEVNSYVDAQNAFGANIRTHFKGVIKRKNGGWVLEYLTFIK